MRLDKFNNPIFNETDVFNILYQGNTSVLPQLSVDINRELINLENIAEIQWNNNSSIDQSITIEEFDRINQSSWFIPTEYKNFDVQSFCISKCHSDHERERVIEELSEFERLGMMALLQWCKYFVDTCTENNILWGVGRGSSVSSYVLYLIGIHRIDSIKYNLDWKEFLR
jgi:DNA polymerase III alpha subunit